MARFDLPTIALPSKLKHLSLWQVSAVLAAVLLAAIILPAAGFAGQAIEKFDLPRCIELALATSPSLRKAGWELELARGELGEAQAGRWPRGELVNLFGLVNRARGDAVFSPDEDTDYLTGLGPFTKLDVSLNIPIYTFGKVSAGIEAAERGLGARKAERAGEEDKVIAQTKELYYSIQLSHQVSELLQEVVENFGKAIEKAKERLEEGKITQTDFIKLGLGKLRFEQEATKVRSAERMATSAMTVAVGLASPRDLKLASLKLRPEEAEVGTLDRYVELALSHRPEWIALKEGIAAEEQRLKVEEREYFPRLFLAGGLRFAHAPNRDDQKNPFVLDEFNFLSPGGVLGVHMSLNWREIAAKVHQQRAKVEKLKADLERARRGLPLAVEKRYLEVIEARKQMELAQKSRRSARTLLLLTMTNFELGIGEPKEVFEGLGAFTEATAGYYRAIHAYNVALAKLSQAVGTEVTKLRYERPRPR